MKKTITSILLVLTIAVCSVMFSACANGVVNETDLYGSFLTEDNTRSITLAADNVAVICYGENANEYYARYDLMSEVVELRTGGFRGDIVYTFTIIDVDTLEIELTLDVPSEPSDSDSVSGEESEKTSMKFMRDKSFNPSI